MPAHDARGTVRQTVRFAQSCFSRKYSSNQTKMCLLWKVLNFECFSCESLLHLFLPCSHFRHREFLHAHKLHSMFGHAKVCHILHVSLVTFSPCALSCKPVILFYHTLPFALPRHVPKSRGTSEGLRSGAAFFLSEPAKLLMIPRTWNLRNHEVLRRSPVFVWPSGLVGTCGR